jgi:hypothetical protein
MGGPNNQYQWLANGSSILDGETSQVLTLSNISADNGGMYTCFVSNIAGNDSASTFVFVYPYIVSHPSSETTSTGSMVRLTCVAEAFPNPEYLWVRADGETIRDDILTNASSLMITSIEYGDQGGYFCNASAREETAISQVAVITGKLYRHHQ